MHGGYGVKIVRTTDSSQRDEYHCALGMAFDQAEKLAGYLYAVHAMPNEAEILIEDWLYDHADAIESADCITERLYRKGGALLPE